MYQRAKVGTNHDCYSLAQMDRGAIASVRLNGFPALRRGLVALVLLFFFPVAIGFPSFTFPWLLHATLDIKRE
jgi:hypothetical protein